MEQRLLEAAATGFSHGVKIYLDLGVNMETRSTDWEKRTPLMVAAAEGRGDTVKILLNRGANREAKDRYGYTAIMVAAINGKKDAVEILLNKGAKIEARDDNGYTTLMLAARSGEKDIAALLLNHRAKIEASDKAGWTALMWSVYKGHILVVKTLVAHGADVSTKNNTGFTALDYANMGDDNRISQILSRPPVPKPICRTDSKPQTKPKLVLPSEWSIHVIEETKETVYVNSETKEQRENPPLAYPLLQEPSYGEDVAFYDEATEEDVTSEGTTIDFENGVKVTVPKGVVPPNTSITLKAQPAFASKEVFVLPTDVEAASPTYLLSASSESLNGDVMLSIEHYVKLRTEEDAKNLVFLIADSNPSEDSTYHFREVDSGHPIFEPGEKVGTISTNHFFLWKVGKRIVDAVLDKMFLKGSQNPNPDLVVPPPTSLPSLYTVRVYRSPENSGKSVAVVCVSYLHTLYAKFLEYLDRELIPSQYPEVSTKAIDQIIVEPLCFEGNELQVQASSTHGWSFNFDKTSIHKQNVDLPEKLDKKPEELHSYPPKIVCRFAPNAKAPKETTCTLTLQGFDRPVSVSLPLFSPKREVDTSRLKEAVFNLRVTAVGIKKTKLAPIAKQIASEMDDITVILRTSTSGEELAQHAKATYNKVLELATRAKEVFKGCTAPHISAQIQVPEVEDVSMKFKQIAMEQLLHCTDIAEAEKLLAELVVMGSKLVSMIEEVAIVTERLSSIAGLDIDHVDNTTRLDVDDDSADILRELDGLEFEYYTLGLHLHLRPGKVKEIQVNNPHNATTALGQVITQWLMINYESNKFGIPSWRMLVEGVSTVDLERAKLIASKHQMITKQTDDLKKEVNSVKLPVEIPTRSTDLSYQTVLVSVPQKRAVDTEKLEPLSEPVPQEKEVPTEKLKVNVQPLSEPVKQERQVHTEKLKNAALKFKVTATAMKGNDLAPTAGDILSSINTITTVIGTSSLEELGQHTDSIHKKVLELISKAREVADSSKVTMIHSARIQAQVSELEDTATEEASLADLVVTGTKLLTAVEDILKTTQRLTSFAGRTVTTPQKPMIKASQDTPLKLKDLNVVYEALYNARSKWEDIGLELNVDPEALISISRNQSEHAECLKEMLSFRLRFPTSGVLTWKLIIESLRANFVAQNDLANAIENSLT